MTDQELQGNIQDQDSSGNHNSITGDVTSGGIALQGDHATANITQNFYQGTSQEKEEDLSTKELKRKFAFEPVTIPIPAGEFPLGSEGIGIKEYEKRHQVFLPLYRISKYPVLNKEYAEFIRQNQKSASTIPLELKSRENEPVRGITWYDAREYCKWLMKVTGRQYDLPTEAQLEKIYQGVYDCSDILDEISLWTCTLWGENLVPPDPKYRYPWKQDDGRNDLNANSQIRRVVCRYRKAAGMDRWQRFSCTGQFPRKPFPPGGYSFRVVINPPHPDSM